MRGMRENSNYLSGIGIIVNLIIPLANYTRSFTLRALDNNKIVCLDEDVILKPNNCTVYSFGIGADITFDDQVKECTPYLLSSFTAFCWC